MLLSMFPVEVQEKLSSLEIRSGSAAMARINRFLTESRGERVAHNPLQRAKHILPGLPEQPWHNISDYPGLRDAAQALEADHPRIKQEFLARLAASNSLDYYGHEGRNKGWKALYLYENGRPVKENIPYFPYTIKCIRTTVEPHLFPLAEAHFSILEPGAQIPPHCDQHNFTLSFHLAVKIPEKCGIRVAGETRRWQEGRCLLFDHSFVHEVWNMSSDRRIVLIMDVWHPSTTPVERDALSIIFGWMFEEFHGIVSE